MVFPEPLSAHVHITAKAQRDLENILRKDRKNFLRLWQDLKQFIAGTLPQKLKKLKGFEPPLWQVNSGDFRILYSREYPVLWIRGVLRKSEQKHRFRASNKMKLSFRA